VVYAVADPHGVAAGGGAQLIAAGIDVEAGVLADEATSVLGRWRTAMASQRPHVTWKYAATLDGKVAAADGTSQWITGREARQDVHRERYLADAVIAGIGTVLADDPQLGVRDWPASRQPTRVVVDTDARTPVTARVLDSSAPTVVVVADDADQSRRTGLEAAGVDVLAVPRLNSHVDLGVMLSALFARDIAIALVEGGPTLATGLVSAGLVDRVVGYYGPLLLGAGPALLGAVGVATLADAPGLTIDDVMTVGSDIRIDARFAERGA
jgi:diaminohydroxyphosphoribosylaminopyrimidine deaminase/5-amino-6-(5-phosphoribosylamino)uracil reductase